MIDSYFVSYFSNQSSNYFKENKSYKFNVFLPHETFFPRELTQKKLIVGLKTLSFQFNNDVNNPSIIGLKSSLIDQANKTDDQILFMTQVNPTEKVQYFSVSRPVYFLTNRQSLASPSFEFTTYNSESGKFEALAANILREDITVHVQVEIKAVDTSMDLQHFNVLVSSSDKESAKMFPSNKPYDFTILKRFEFPENEKWVMGLKSLIIPGLIQNAELPDFGISYKLEMIPKDRQFYLPFVETYSGSLPQKHFESVDHFFTSLSEMLRKISIIHNAFKVENNNKLMVANPMYLVYKAGLLKRPPPPSPPPRQESDEEMQPGDIDLPPADADELGLDEEAEDNVEEMEPGDLPSPDADDELGLDEVMEAEDNVEEMEPGDIDLPPADADELGTDKDNNMEPEPESEEMEEATAEEDRNEIQKETLDRERNEILKDNKETPMDVIQNKTLKRTRSDDDNKSNKKKQAEDNERNEIQKDNNNKESGMEIVQDNKRDGEEESGMEIVQDNKRDREEEEDEGISSNKIQKEKSVNNERNVIQKNNNNEETGMEIVQDNKTPSKRVREEEEDSNNILPKEKEGEEGKKKPPRKKPRWRRRKQKDQNKERKTRSVEDTVDAGEQQQEQKWNNVLDYTMAKEILLNDVEFDHLNFPKDDFEPDPEIRFANEKVREVFQIQRLAQTKATHTFKLHFELSKMLAKMFGITEENRSIQVTDAELYTEHEKAYCQRTEETNLNFGIPQTILLNCDLIEESLVGNKKLPLLKHIFLGDKVLERDRQHQFNFNIDQWYEVKMKNTSRFNLRITDLLGNPVSLQEDQHKLSTIVELIFKKVNHGYNY